MAEWGLLWRKCKKFAWKSTVDLLNEWENYQEKIKNWLAKSFKFEAIDWYTKSFVAPWQYERIWGPTIWTSKLLFQLKINWKINKNEEKEWRLLMEKNYQKSWEKSVKNYENCANAKRLRKIKAKIRVEKYLH